MCSIKNFFFNLYAVCLFSLFLLLATGCATESAVNHDIKKVEQNLATFAAANSSRQLVVTPKQTKHLEKNYRKHYFAPWTTPWFWQDKIAVKNSETQIIAASLQHPGWDANKNLHSQDWVEQIRDNMQLLAYPNMMTRAITVRHTAVRVLPTESPSFSAWDIPGQGFPFDNLQVMELITNTPLMVLHATRDGQWSLVITPYNCYGWVKSLDVATVTQNLYRQFLRAKYVVTLNDHTPIFDSKMQYYVSAKIGMLLPLVKISPAYYKVLLAVRDQNSKAIAKIVNLRKTQARIWPLTITQNKIAQIAQKLLAQPYGWGDLYGYRDCSETIKTLFAPFAIWLPRNSADQAQTGEFIPLENLSNQQKEAVIIKEGVPFLSLIWLRGHIMLYVGAINGQAYVLHNFWGLHTKNFLYTQEGRVVIGRTAITNLYLGEQYLNVMQIFLDSVLGMTNLQLDAK